MDAAADGEEIVVTNGLYAPGGRAVYGTMTNRVAIDRAVTVRSVNGPLVTTIEGRAVPGTTNGDGAIRCAYVGDNAVLSGFTLTNGHTRATAAYFDEMSAGGARCMPSGVVTNCILSGNSARGGGGTFGSTLNNCTLVNNSATLDGGGVSDNSIGPSSLSVLNNCVLIGNSAGRHGGGAKYSTLNNCTLVGNSADYGGGGEDNCDLNNCTLTGNWASNFAGGAYLGRLDNCVVYYNSAPNYPNYNALYFQHCCTTPLPAGPGNIDSEPLFVDTNGWSNLRLQSNSPCINSGNNAYAPDLDDLDGQPRISGGTVDMGAYEFQSPASAISYHWLMQYGLPTDGSADYTDSDRDGLNNWQEWVAGTSPVDTASALRILSVTAVTNGWTGTWQSVNGIDYFLDGSTNLAAPLGFSVIQSNIPGQGLKTSYTDVNAPGSGPCFYRVGVAPR